MLFLIIGFVKTFLADDAREHLLADADLHRCSKFCVSLVHHSHADASVSRDAAVTCCNYTYLLTFNLHRIASTRNHTSVLSPTQMGMFPKESQEELEKMTDKKDRQECNLARVLNTDVVGVGVH